MPEISLRVFCDGWFGWLTGVLTLPLEPGEAAETNHPPHTLQTVVYTSNCV